MNKKKKTVLIILLFLFLLIILLFTFFRKKETKVTIFPRSGPQKVIPTEVETKFGTESAVIEENYNIKSEASLIHAKPPKSFTDEEAFGVAKGLGFISEPIISNDIFDGKTFIWRGETYSLVLWSKSRKFEYSLNENVGRIDKQLSTKEIIAIAKNFLVTQRFFQEDKIEFTHLTYLKKDPRDPEDLYEATPEDATIFKVNFFPLKTGTKIVTLNPLSSPISIWVLLDGTIGKSEVSFLGDLSLDDKKFKTLSYQEFIDSLQQATLISLDDGNILLSTLDKNDIKNITIKEVELAYLIDTTREIVYHPILYIKGKATVKNIPEEVNAILYLPAISKAQP